MASAKDRAGNKITLTGSGTFVAPEGGSSKLATGGGTWVISGGPDAGRGTYEVTEVISWREAPGTLPATALDTIGNPADSRAGLAVLRIRYNDGSLGVLVVSCRTPGTPPADGSRIFEGIQVSKGFLWFMGHEEPVDGVEGERTLFHVIKDLAAAPTEQGVTRASLGRGAATVKEPVTIEAGKTDLQVSKITMQPGAYISWHQHPGPSLLVMEKGTLTMTQTDGSTADYPAGSAFVEPKGSVHRMDNKGNAPVVVLITRPVAGGPPAETPPTVFVPDPTTKLAVQPPTQAATSESIGRGAGNVKEPVKIEAGKVDIRAGKTILAPGGYAGWHYHNGPGLVVVEKGTVTVKQADGTTTDYPAGSAFFEAKGAVHRADNKGSVDAVLLATFAIAGGPPAETPTTVFVPDPTVKQ